MLYTPNGISFPDLLKKKGWNRTPIKNHTWKFHYVFTQVVKLSQLRQTDFVQLNIADLDKFFKVTHIHDKKVRMSKVVLDYLSDWNIIIRRHHNNEYETEAGDKLYKTEVFVKVWEEVLAAGWSVWNEPETLAPTPREAKIIKKNALTGIYKRLDEQLHRITIDGASAREITENAYLTKLPLRSKRREFLLADNTKAYKMQTGRYVNQEVRSSWLSWIDAVEAGDFASAQDEHGTGRFYNRLSSSPGEIRDTLRMDGLRMQEGDISNSQPLIFCTYLLERYAANMPENVREFISECENGTFYATVRKLVLTAEEDAKLSKSDFKVLFFARIFYSTEKVNYVWRQKFAAEYPDVSEFITEMKRTGYKDLPRALSRRESDIMLHGVAARLLDAKATFYPLHDAIYAAAKDMALVEQVIREEFAKRGVWVHIKLPVAPVGAVPVAVPDESNTSNSSVEDELLARLEAEFAALEAQQADDPYDILENVPVGEDTDFWKD